MLWFQGSLNQYRRRWVTWLAVLLLVLTLANLVRTGVAITYWRRLPQLPMTVSWLYLAVCGLLWTVAFGMSALGLSQYRAWGRWMSLTVVTVYVIHKWFDYLCFGASAYTRRSWGWDAVGSGILLVTIWAFLNWRSVRKVLE